MSAIPPSSRGNAPGAKTTAEARAQALLSNPPHTPNREVGEKRQPPTNWDLAEEEPKPDNAPPGIETVYNYFRDMEARIKTLEAQVAQLGGTPVPQHALPSSRPSLRRQRATSSAILRVLELSQDDFERPDQDSAELHAIEVMLDPAASSKSAMARAIRIRSVQLLDALREILSVDSVPDAMESIVVRRPFKALVPFYTTFKSRVLFNADFMEKTGLGSSNDDSRVRLQSLRDLLNHLEDYMRDDLNSCDYMKDGRRDAATFAQLWYLFQPGDILVEGDEQPMQAYLVLRTSGDGEHHQARAYGTLEDPVSSVLTLHCVSFGWDGKTFGLSPKTFHISNFPGTKPIATLPVQPIRGETAEELRLRGRRFAQLTMPRHQFYSGVSLDSHIPQEIDGEVVVDLQLFYREHPDKVPVFSTLDFLEDIGTDQLNRLYDDSQVDIYLTKQFLAASNHLLEVHSYDELSDLQLILLPNLVWGFYLRGRKWHALNLSVLSDIIYPHHPFEYLVLPSSHKKILSSLVSQHNPSSLMDGSTPEGETGTAQGKTPGGNLDIVKGKGKGLIVLLHGSPGVGKTSTAECLAAYAKRPLFPITAGDIGITAAEFEESLSTIFALSQRWGCVLLLDEADILLQARDRVNLQRNAIVSVFLRAMEYYNGILIMTTTRVGAIDEAFKSRIHAILYYPALGRTQSMEIWEMSLRRLRESKKVTMQMDKLMSFFENLYEQQDRKLNGREIKNVLTTAVALAEVEKEREGDDDGGPAQLTRHHIQQVLRMSNEFDKYMEVVHGGTDARVARREGLRDDGFMDSPKYVRGSRPPPSRSEPLYTTSVRARDSKMSKPLAVEDESEEVTDSG